MEALSNVEINRTKVKCDPYPQPMSLIETDLCRLKKGVQCGIKNFEKKVFFQINDKIVQIIVSTDFVLLN